MLNNPETLYYWQTLADAVAVYQRQQVNCAPVLDAGGEVVGIITVFRLLEALQEGATMATPIEEVMERKLVCIDEDTGFEKVANLPIDRLIVLNKERRLSGVLTRIGLINKVHHALEKAERELAAVLEAVPNGIVAVDREGKICHINPAAARLLDVPVATAMEQPANSILAAAGLTRFLAKEAGDQFHKAGVGDRTLAIRRSSINKEGQEQGVVLILQDISELEAISSELKAVKSLNRQLKSVIEACYDGMVIVDSQGIVRGANEAYERIMAPETGRLLVVGEKLQPGTGQAEEQLYQLWHLVRESRKAVTVMYQTPSDREAILTGSPVFNEEGAVSQVVISIRDMTELRHLKEEAMRAAAEIQVLRARQLAAPEVIRHSLSMQKVVDQALRVAAVDSTVLITGESGVGKEVVAGLIHRHSPRCKGPFIEINCGAIPENLLESELFGYEKGAFTGASKEGKIGLLEVANNGTIFLDEIGDLSLGLQVKLLRFLQEQEIYRLGGRQAIKLNVRVIAATNKDLAAMVREKTFREDLYYRLNVVPIRIPPLRERREDILPLARYFLEIFNHKYGTDKRLSFGACKVLEAYSWPGNVRELQNVMERVVIMGEGDVIRPEHLPIEFQEGTGGNTCKWLQLKDVLPLQEAREQLERQLITLAIAEYGTLRRAARALGISHSTLLRKAQAYGLVVQNRTDAV
nr:sigma-54-dependent Fis family transcriptional regulator [Moorella sulfitireducens]